MAFTDLLFHLREYGLKVSVNEWMLLMEALGSDLAHSSLYEFYHLSRAILVKSEADYDRFDLAFASFFGEITDDPALSDQLMRFLDNGVDQQDYDKDEVDAREKLDHEQLRNLLGRRLRQQRGPHNGGSKWIGTGGTSPLGNSGYARSGLRIGGERGRKSALRTARGRGYRDFREDNILGIRNYQMAFKRLRQMSADTETQEKEIDIDRTVDQICRNGGLLKIEYKKPRKNALKLLMLFDSGGSMDPYAKLSNELFQAVSKANHFSKLKIYYFHNCVYNRIYTSPACIFSESIETEWLLNNISSEYRVIMVGDASLAMWEMRYYSGGREGRPGDHISGLAWLEKIIKKYEHAIWLNPLPRQEWSGIESVSRISSEIPMYPLSIEGIQNGIKRLMSGRHADQ